MRLLVDQQLPIALARSLAAEGLDCAHVQDLGLDASSDAVIWHHARDHGFTIVSKDDDFQALANRHGPPPQVVWVRMGNCRKQALLDRFHRLLPALLQELQAGTAVVEIR